MKKQSANGAQYHRGIRIDLIPIKGIGGLIFVLATMGLFLWKVPATRQFLLISAVAGVIGAGLLYFWHNRRIR